ncbi:hypothetical protein BDA96_03G367100 [Sorghum bicolor]|nr:uncharacterized protein LOC8057724 [Sorghum bicolor]KAG0539956.1 hypothetical protein BDA96_03G367100 [Sorghum bicolor]|eukprot:XP_002456559.2 uncharacterized protein LOC8057724 [Sorghum bicolor]
MPPGPGVVADHQAPPAQPPRSPHRGNGGAMPMPQSPLRIKQDGKFYERLLTKESSAANLSFRYYWAEPGAVPFVWESQPGTPKDVARMGAAGALPAITPPPSYLLRHGDGVASARHDQKSGGSGRAARSSRKRRCRLKRIRIGFVAGILRRLSLGKRWRRQRPATPVKVASSSSRWLFSSVATETGEHNDIHQDEIGAVVAAHPKQHKAVPCSFPTLWLLRFRNSSGNRAGGRNDGWA